MKIKRIGNNQTLLILDNSEILVSYETAVAARRGGKLYVTDTNHSRTTSKHIKAYIGREEATTRPQSFFNELMTISNV